MRKLVSSFFISLDGVVEAPQNWHFPYHDEEMGAAIDDSIAASDTFLVGRRTYEEWAVFWPHQDPAALPVATAMNETPKFVASRTLDEVGWQNSTLLEGDLAEAVVEVRHHHGVAEVGEALAHVVERRAQATGVGIHDHRRPRPGAVGGVEAGVHRAVGGLDRDVALRHQLLLGSVNTPDVGTPQRRLTGRPPVR